MERIHHLPGFRQVFGRGLGVTGVPVHGDGPDTLAERPVSLCHQSLNAATLRPGAMSSSRVQ